MRLVLISDTHNLHSHLNLPEGDVLIHAGDMSGRGSLPEVASFLHWFGQQPHPHKIFIAGNHDWLFQKDPGLARSLVPHNVHYLEDTGVTIGGINFWGSPWQPEFHNWAFNLPRGEPLRRKWGLIPYQTHVLITHGPPYGIVDAVPHVFSGTTMVDHTGDRELLKRMGELPHLKLSVHGHIHEAYGQEVYHGVTVVNASTCDHSYQAENLRPPIVIDLPTGNLIQGIPLKVSRFF